MVYLFSLIEKYRLEILLFFIYAIIGAFIIYFFW